MAATPQPAPAEPRSDDPTSPLSLAARRGVWALIVVALALRLGYLLLAVAGPHFKFADPDHYLRVGAMLAGQGEGWHWTPDAVIYLKHVKAPLYQVCLSLLALAPEWYPLSVGLCQALLSAGAVGCLFVIGRTVHSTRAGFIAAGLLAVYLPATVTVTMILQENLYVPLLLTAFALLLTAVAWQGPPARFALAGCVLGLAALTRSMPAYYLLPATLLLAVTGRDRATTRWQALAFLGGFLAVALPYSFYISWQMGDVILIDNMGSIHFATAYPASRAVVHRAPPPSFVEIANMIARTLAASPLGFLGDRLENVRSLFRLTAGQWLQHDAWAPTRAAALGLKALAHFSEDLVFALAAVLAPLGWAFARRRREAALVGLWAVLNLGLLAALAWGGARYRAPYEAHLMALAAPFLAGGGLRPPRRVLLLAVLASLSVAWAVQTSLPQTARGRAAYGVPAWWRTEDGPSTRARGRIGFVAMAADGQVRIELSALRHARRRQPPSIRAWLGGEAREALLEGNQSRTLVLPWNGGPAYVELEPRLGGQDWDGEYRVRILTREGGEDLPHQLQPSLAPQSPGGRERPELDSATGRR